MPGAGGFSPDGAIGLEQPVFDRSNRTSWSELLQQRQIDLRDSEPAVQRHTESRIGEFSYYTPNPSFSGLDSFTFNVTDTTNAAGPLTSAVASVNLVVSATGVTPSLKLTCPAVTYNLNPHGCTTVLTPFVAGTTTISYNGSGTLPAAAGSYPVSASFVSSGSSSQNTSATGVLVISQATPTLTVLCPTLPFTGSPQGCATPIVAGIGTFVPSGTVSITYNGSSTPPTSGGTYAVLASFTSGDPNYASTTVTSSLTIYEPVVTITANSQTISYSGVLPILTYAVSPSIFLQTNPVCTSSATGTSNVGTYAGAITCSGAAKVGTLFAYECREPDRGTWRGNGNSE